MKSSNVILQQMKQTSSRRSDRFGQRQDLLCIYMCRLLLLYVIKPSVRKGDSDIPTQADGCFQMALYGFHNMMWEPLLQSAPAFHTIPYPWNDLVLFQSDKDTWVNIGKVCQAKQQLCPCSSERGKNWLKQTSNSFCCWWGGPKRSVLGFMTIDSITHKSCICHPQVSEECGGSGHLPTNPKMGEDM